MGRTDYHWVCGCGVTGSGEAAAQRHNKDDGCTMMGWPAPRAEAARRRRESGVPSDYAEEET